MSRGTAARGVAGIACLVLAAIAVLLARDVWHVESALEDADTRVSVTKLDPTAWSAATTLPFALAPRLLGVRDDVAFRRLLARARTMTARPSNDDEVRRRLPVKEALLVAEQDADHTRASEAANMLGVIYSTDPNEPDKPAVEKALAEFVTAVQLDPTNETAKANLELLLRQSSGNSLRGRKGAAAGEVPGKSGAGRRAGGHGY
jgi:hypothetical protein